MPQSGRCACQRRNRSAPGSATAPTARKWSASLGRPPHLLVNIARTSVYTLECDDTMSSTAPAGAIPPNNSGRRTAMSVNKKRQRHTTHRAPAISGQKQRRSGPRPCIGASVSCLIGLNGMEPHGRGRTSVGAAVPQAQTTTKCQAATLHCGSTPSLRMVVRGAARVATHTSATRRH